MKAGYPQEIRTMDIVGPLPTSKRRNKYILTILSGGLRHLTSLIRRQWQLLLNLWPCFLQTINAYLTTLWYGGPIQVKDILILRGITKMHTTPYHPQSDGLIKQLNRTILSMLATTIKDHGEEWENHLAKMCFAYNTSVHKPTEFYLLQRRQARCTKERHHIVFLVRVSTWRLARVGRHENGEVLKKYLSITKYLLHLQTEKHKQTSELFSAEAFIIKKYYPHTFNVLKKPIHKLHH